MGQPVERHCTCELRSWCSAWIGGSDRRAISRPAWSALRSPADADKKLVECAALIGDRFQSQEGGDQLSGFEAWMDAQNLPRLSQWGVAADALDALALEGMAASSSKKNAVVLTHQDFIRILEESL